MPVKYTRSCYPLTSAGRRGMCWRSRRGEVSLEPRQLLLQERWGYRRRHWHRSLGCADGRRSGVVVSHGCTTRIWHLWARTRDPEKESAPNVCLSSAWQLNTHEVSGHRTWWTSTANTWRVTTAHGDQVQARWYSAVCGSLSCCGPYHCARRSSSGQPEPRN